MTLNKVYSLSFLVGLEYVPLDMTITGVLLESYQCINMHQDIVRLGTVHIHNNIAETFP